MSLIGWPFTPESSHLILCVLMAALASAAAAMEAVVAASSVTVEKVDTKLSTEEDPSLW